jgi:hypothetical protein
MKKDEKDKKQKMRTSTLHEAVGLAEATIDEESRMVRGVTIIAPGWSANRRYYPADVLAEAMPLFDGAKAYADHPSKGDIKNRPERSIHDLVGWYEEVRADDAGRMRADLFVEDDRVWPKVKAAVEKKPDYVGISINAVGLTAKGEAEGQKGIIVEAITHVTSGDVVTTPAAGGGFEQMMASDDGMARAILKTVSLEEIRETRPDFERALLKEFRTPRDNAALKEAKEEVKTLAEQHRTARGELQAAKAQIAQFLKERAVDRLLANRHLPDAWKAQLRADLLAAEMGEWVAMLEGELAKVQTVKGKVHVHGAGRPAPPPAPTEKPAPRRSILGGELNESSPRPDESYTQFERRVRATGE